MKITERITELTKDAKTKSDFNELIFGGIFATLHNEFPDALFEDILTAWEGRIKQTINVNAPDDNIAISKKRFRFRDLSDGRILISDLFSSDGVEGYVRLSFSGVVLQDYFIEAASAMGFVDYRKIGKQMYREWAEED